MTALISSSAAERPYHHGDLRKALIDAAVAEVAAEGASALSMRAIARRAGVSHAAPAHHFGDKAGIFTAIAVEGFDLMTKTIAPVAFEEQGFIAGGTAYVLFALEHPGYFEVMFRPTLYDLDDPALVAARDGAFDVLVESARHAIAPARDRRQRQRRWPSPAGPSRTGSPPCGCRRTWSTSSDPTRSTRSPVELRPSVRSFDVPRTLRRRRTRRTSSRSRVSARWCRSGSGSRAEGHRRRPARPPR